LMANLSFTFANTPFSGRFGVEVFYIRTLVCLCGFGALYAQQAQRLRQMAADEAGQINELLHQQHEQFLATERAVEHANRLHHDLKHHIEAIRAEADADRRSAHLDDLEASIAEYTAQADTGNGVLDVLLTNWGKEFAERGVEFTYVVDGAALSFLSTMDLTAIFGNALDNALEAVLEVPQPDRRLVKAAVYARDRLVMATFENYFAGELRRQEGEIVSRKADKRLHGYGLKSIRFTAEKYGGSMTVSTEDNWFTLRILLPSP
ncbi:MAG: ATP-binding protein, partial [Promicromonosporaceae bacterium]|nr:ATP-binding protein [Promicromonosporaceae bacterium]